MSAPSKNVRDRRVERLPVGRVYSAALGKPVSCWCCPEPGTHMASWFQPVTAIEQEHGNTAAEKCTTRRMCIGHAGSWARRHGLSIEAGVPR